MSEQQTYVFGDLDHRGKFFGLHLPQFFIVWLVLFSVIPLLNAGSVWGVLRWLGVMAVLSGVGFGRVMDRGLWEWVPVLLGRLMQLMMGENVLRGGPRVDREENSNPVLNGPAGALRWLRLPDGRGSAVGVIYNPKERSYSATLQVSSAAFSLLDSISREQRVNGWGSLMAQLATYGSPFIRLVVMERTVPDSGIALQRHFDHSLESVAPSSRHDTAISAYQQLIEEKAQQAQRHETFITVTMSVRKVTREVRNAGGGEDGALAVLFKLLAAFERTVKRIGLTSEGWLNPRELAAVVRTQYDPASLEVIDQRGRGEFAARVGNRRIEMPAGVDPASAGPCAGRAANDYYQTDSAFTRVFWCSSLPRTEATAAFHSPLVLESECRRTITLIMEPVPNRKAEAQLNRKQMRQDGDQQLRDRFGKATTRRDEMEVAENSRKLDELLSGHGLMRMTLFVAVSADDLDGLEEVTGHIGQLANLSKLELRTLYAQQPAAFAAACLPLGLGVLR